MTLSLLQLEVVGFVLLILVNKEMVFILRADLLQD
jgi:hypothetical protein